jgi:hypothetical protein
MRDDLLDALASVDWAVSQIKILTQRISDWRRSRPYIAVTAPDSAPGYQVFKVQRAHSLPLMVNAEAGAIINMIRSSLDILAVALAERNGHMRPKDVYFPIAASVHAFIDPKDGAIKKIARLTESDRLVIERLKPYSGGDETLFSLHQLDIVRKHQRLVDVSATQRSIALFRSGHHLEPEVLYAGRLEDGALLYRIPTNPDATVHIAVEVTFDETPFAKGRPVLDTLHQFASRAKRIIDLFDI